MWEELRFGKEPVLLFVSLPGEDKRAAEVEPRCRSAAEDLKS